MNKKLIATIMSKIGKLSFFFIVTIITTITFTSCNKDDDDETISDSGDKVYYQGVNIIGIWAENDVGYDRDNGWYTFININTLYVVRADGTMTCYKYKSNECDCDRTLTNGVINCSLDHYTFSYAYKYSIEGNSIWVSGYALQPEITIITSDDKIYVNPQNVLFRDGTFNRVKFAQ